MKVDTVIRIGENMNVVILHTRDIEPIQESERVLQVDVVVCYAVHHQETHIALQSGHVADRGIFVPIRVILRRLHVSFGVDGV